MATPQKPRGNGSKRVKANAGPRGPQSVAADWSPVNLGNALRAIRLERGLSLSDLARESDLSASFLSQVETGQSDLSVGRLIRVAQALGVGITDILELPPPSNGPVLRARDRAMVPMSAKGVRVFLLAPSLDKKRTYSLGIFEEGAKIPMPVRNRGSEYFIYVIEGAMRLEYTTGESVILEVGDSASHISDESRLIANVFAGQSTFLWVQTAVSR